MAFSPSSPVTGAAQTGLTSPTYTLTIDTPPNSHSKQFAVTALGGTQTGVEAHSVSNPFTVTMERPVAYKQLGQPNPVTGVVANVPRNRHVVRVRKGTRPLVGQNPVVSSVTTNIDTAAGADLADPLSIKAMLSCAFGTLSQQSQGIGDTAISGVL